MAEVKKLKGNVLYTITYDTTPDFTVKNIKTIDRYFLGIISGKYYFGKIPRFKNRDGGHTDEIMNESDIISIEELTITNLLYQEGDFVIFNKEVYEVVSFDHRPDGDIFVTIVEIKNSTNPKYRRKAKTNIIYLRKLAVDRGDSVRWANSEYFVSHFEYFSVMGKAVLHVSLYYENREELITITYEELISEF